MVEIDLSNLDDGSLEKLKQLVTQANSGAVALDALGAAIFNAGTNAEKLSMSIARMRGNLVEGIAEFKLLNDVLGMSTDDAIDFGIKAGAALSAVFDILPGGVDAFGKLGQAGNTAGTQITESFKTLSPMISKLGTVGAATAAGMNRLFASADQARNLEMNLLKGAAAAGDLNAVIDASQLSLEGLRDEQTSFSELTYRVAQATGTASSAVSDYAQQLMVIPGALRENVDLTMSEQTSMNGLEATMKVAAGTHQQFSDVVEQLNTVYRQLGTTGTDALSVVARMARAAQDLHMPMDIVRDYTLKTAEAFKFMGDNTQGAISIMAGMRGALRDSGLGPQAIAEITSGITDGIANMDVATKAFISSAAGGDGGLAGAFGIDILLQQNKLGDVLNMVETAMRDRFGGPVVTLNDVGANPALAGELFKQVQFLTEVAGVAKDQQQAYRILDAMKSGSLSEAKEAMDVEAPEEALQGAIEDGTKVQELQHNVMTDISNKMQRMLQLQHITNLALTRETFGIEGMGAYLEDIMSTNSTIASSKGAVGAEGEQRTSVENVRDEVIGDFKGALGGAGDLMGGFLETVRDKLPDSIKEKFDKATGGMLTQKKEERAESKEFSNLSGSSLFEMAPTPLAGGAPMTAREMVSPTVRALPAGRGRPPAAPNAREMFTAAGVREMPVESEESLLKKAGEAGTIDHKLVIEITNNGKKLGEKTIEMKKGQAASEFTGVNTDELGY